MKSWFKLLRIVNLPTVPGDVLLGAAASIVALRLVGASPWVWTADRIAVLIAAVVISCCLYLYGLIDNDLVGAATDTDRPIPKGEISRLSARCAEGVLLLVLTGVVFSVIFPMCFYPIVLALFFAIVIYNRTKLSVLMGGCRGLNVALGVSIVNLENASLLWPLVAVGIVTLYIAFVTFLSKGEETNPARKQLIGQLIGAHVYLQLIGLLVCALIAPETNDLLLTGGILLLVLRVMKKLLPQVSAS